LRRRIATREQFDSVPGGWLFESSTFHLALKFSENGLNSTNGGKVAMKQSASKHDFSNLSDTLKTWRNATGLTQRQVAQEIGVKPSYVAYLEAGERQPSLALALRLADLMKADPVKICVAAHPELEEILSNEPKPPSNQNDTWKRFITEAALIKRHHITEEELGVLKEVNRLVKVKKPRNLLFILNSIRQALAND